MAGTNDQQFGTQRRRLMFAVATRSGADWLDIFFVRTLEALGVKGKTIGSISNPNELPLMARWRLARFGQESRSDTRGGWQVVLHQFMRGDDRRLGVHDHPWRCWSLVFKGSYIEKFFNAALGADDVRERGFGYLGANAAEHKHVVLKVNGDADGTNGHCWTIAVLSPRERRWGFPGAGVEVN